MVMLHPYALVANTLIYSDATMMQSKICLSSTKGKCYGGIIFEAIKDQMSAEILVIIFLIPSFFESF